MAEEEQVVTYSTKELFEKIDKNVNDVKTLLGTKADEADLISLRTEVQSQGVDIAALQAGASNRKYLLAAIVLPTLSILLATITLILYKK